MSSPSKSSTTTLIGAGLALLANGLHLCSMYLVKTHPISPGDTLIFRAVLTVLIFGVWSGLDVYRSSRGYVHLSEVETGWKIWMAVIICNLGMAVVVLLSFLALQMIPLSDFIVFSFTAPIFALITSYFIIRSRITVVSILFAFFIVMGAGMVAQPTFIFGHENPVYKNTYAAGATMGFLCAIGSGTARVLQSYTKKVQTSHFMLVGGFTALLLGFASPLFSVPNSILELDTLLENPDTAYGFASAATSLASALLLLIAVKTTGNPVLISVVRSTEIVMGLLLDIACPSHAGAMDFASMTFWYKVMGAVVVTASVIGITLSDKIYDRFLSCIGKPNRSHYAEIGREEDSSEDSEEEEEVDLLV